MKAEQSTERVMDWLEGSMNTEEARIFLEEMAKDPELAMECDILSALTSDLRDLDADVEPSTDFHHNLMAMIRLEGRRVDERPVHVVVEELLTNDSSAAVRQDIKAIPSRDGWSKLIVDFFKRRTVAPIAAAFCGLVIFIVFVSGNLSDRYSSAPATNQVSTEGGVYDTGREGLGNNIYVGSVGSGGSAGSGSSTSGSSGANDLAYVAPSSPSMFPSQPAPDSEKMKVDTDSEWGDNKLHDDERTQFLAPEVAEESTVDVESAVASGTGRSNGGTDGTSSQAIDARKIIRSGHIHVEVDNFSEAVDAIKFTVMRLGGYVTSETSYIIDGRERKAGEVSVKVPYSQYDQMVSQIETLGKVTDSRVWAEDVTAQYVDLQARLGVYETKRERLLDLLEESGDLEAILQIENEWAATNAELESMKGQMRYLVNQTDYSALAITLSEKSADAVGINTDGFAGFAGRVGEAFLLGVNGSIRGLGDLLVWLAGNLIGIVFVAFILWFSWILWIKGWLDKRKEKTVDGASRNSLLSSAFSSGKAKEKGILASDMQTNEE